MGTGGYLSADDVRARRPLLPLLMTGLLGGVVLVTAIPVLRVPHRMAGERRA